MPRKNSLSQRCGWDTKRVPRAWKELAPGTPYAPASQCAPKMAGRTITTRRGGRLTIEGCATPVKPSAARLRTASRAAVCQGAFVLRDPANPRGGIAATLPKSTVRERLRASKRPKLCDHTAVWVRDVTLTDLRGLEAQAHAEGYHPWEMVGDLEFPHRRGSSPCCRYWPSPLTRAQRDACWNALWERVARRQRVARFSAGREAVQRKRDFERAGGDVFDTAWTETLRTNTRKRAGVRAFRPG